MKEVSIEAYYFWDCPKCGSREELGTAATTGEEVTCSECGGKSVAE